ncbi:MAG: nucleotidyltransferase family protein [Candidatus Desantisbacteria bacterium]
MKTREEVLKMLKSELPCLKEKYGIEKIGIFGSYSREEQDIKSDIDLLVQLERPIGLFKFIAVEEHLKERLGIKVEMVTEDAIKPLIKLDVMKEVVYV